jgi:hypothetical protein
LVASLDVSTVVPFVGVAPPPLAVQPDNRAFTVAVSLPPVPDIVRGGLNLNVPLTLVHVTLPGCTVALADAGPAPITVTRLNGARRAPVPNMNL